MRIFRLDVRTLGQDSDFGYALRRATSVVALGPAQAGRSCSRYCAFALSALVSIASAAPPDQATLEEQQEPHTAIPIDPKLPDAYVGFYQNPTTGFLMVVTRDGDHYTPSRQSACA